MDIVAVVRYIFTRSMIVKIDMEKASIGSCFRQQAKRHMEKSRAQPFPQARFSRVYQRQYILVQQGIIQRLMDRRMTQVAVFVFPIQMHTYTCIRWRALWLDLA